MAILSAKQKIEPYIKTASGYVKNLLSDEHIVLNSGQTLKELGVELENMVKNTEMHNNQSQWKKVYDTATENQVNRLYTMYDDHLQIAVGSIVKLTAANKKYVFLFSYKELGNMLKPDNPGFIGKNATCLNIRTYNGDYASFSQLLPSPIWWQSSDDACGFYQYFPTATANPIKIRINYVITYFKP